MRRTLRCRKSWHQGVVTEMQQQNIKLGNLCNVIQTPRPKQSEKIKHTIRNPLWLSTIGQLEENKKINQCVIKFDMYLKFDQFIKFYPLPYLILFIYILQFLCSDSIRTWLGPFIFMRYALFSSFCVFLLGCVLTLPLFLVLASDIFLCGFLIMLDHQQNKGGHMQLIYIMYKHEQLENVTLEHGQTYKIEKKIGKGVSAQVYKAYGLKNKTRFAIKAIPKQYLNSHEKLKQLAINQITILKQSNNENVIKLYDVFQTTLSILIVTELCNGDLEQYLMGKLPLSQDTAVFYLKQLINGFRGLHEVGVMHRDFKLANILIRNEVCKIADLGYAKKMKIGQLTKTLLGTKITMAPEVLQGKEYGYCADIWSLGVVFYQMLFGDYPYQGINEYDLLKNIRQKQVIYHRRRISNEAIDFIRRCLDPNPKKRLSWNEVYHHPLIDKKHFEILVSIYNPVPVLHKNQEFYKNSKQVQFNWQSEQTPKDGCPSLVNSLRKKLIIEEINSIVRNTMGKMNESLKEEELSNLLFKYAKQYIHYFNKLVSSFKFLRLSLIERRSEEINSFLSSSKKMMKANNEDSGLQMSEHDYIELQSLIYLACKKSYIEVLELCRDIGEQKNIFKIPRYWQEFIKSDYYNELQSTIEYNTQKVAKIMTELSEHACLSQCPQISIDACSQDYRNQNKEFSKIWRTYLIRGARPIVQFYKNDEKEDEQLRQFMEGLLYYLVNDESVKLTPEQFDYRLGEPGVPSESRQDLLVRYDVFFNYM